jgi:hypothetical protein
VTRVVSLLLVRGMERSLKADEGSSPAKGLQIGLAVSFNLVKDRISILSDLSPSRQR